MLPGKSSRGKAWRNRKGQGGEWDGIVTKKPKKVLKMGGGNSLKPVAGMKNGILTLLAALAVLALGTPLANATVNIDLVQVGNAGNAADTTTYGAVSYDYAIGKYDVTVGQYTEFLNAVGATDTYNLYNASMATNLNVAGISRSGSSGSYTYSVIGSANHPVTYVSWYDAARFSNWLANGQPTGSQTAVTTEGGAYTLNGNTGIITINSGATWYIPTEDEWYKAAYYDPTLNSGSGGYWQYPTKSNTAPGNTIGSGANQANCNNGVYSVTQSGSYSSSQNYLTDVGVFSGSGSAYGTYDQGGDVFQWNDAVISGSYRGLRGGSWGNDAFALQSSGRLYNDPTLEYPIVGFRLASVPEPTTMGLVLLVGAGLFLWKRRKIAV